jgi:hypothetical protein
MCRGVSGVRPTIRRLLGQIATLAGLWAWFAFLFDRASAYRFGEKWQIVALFALVLPGLLCLAACSIGQGGWKVRALTVGLAIHATFMTTLCLAPILLLAYYRIYHPGKLGPTRSISLDLSLLPSAAMTTAYGLGFLLLASGFTPVRRKPRRCERPPEAKPPRSP